VQLEIVEVTFPGDVIDVTEEGTFKVKVTNTGPLKLTDVNIKVKGLNGTTVKHGGAAAQFGSEFVTGLNDNVNAHGGSSLTQGGALHFRAPSSPHASQPLIEATLDEWRGSLAHMLDAHSRPLDTVKATFAAQVHPA
jgi:hypothetical protein